MNVIKTAIDGVIKIEPKIFSDPRGYFFECFSEKNFNDQIRHIKFVQDNESKSSHGVIRGLHYQAPPFAQSKLIRVIKGRILDVAVDIRRGSPTFGKYVAEILTDEKKEQLFIPRGFAHGFSVLSEEAIIQYKCDNFYNPSSEGGFAWNDMNINIDWRVNPDSVLLSDKDTKYPTLTEENTPFDYNMELY